MGLSEGICLSDPLDANIELLSTFPTVDLEYTPDQQLGVCQRIASFPIKCVSKYPLSGRLSGLESKSIKFKGDTTRF